MRGLSLEDTRRLVKFDDVRREVGERAALCNPDEKIEMHKLRITPELDIEIPKMGTYRMTDWAKKQLGSILGVQWTKWFDPKLVNHDRVQDEIQHRFAKTGDVRKLRTARFKDGTPGVPGCDGYLRAILGPTYHPIDNERIFDRLEREFGSRVGQFNFMKNHLHRKGSWNNDHCHHFTLVGDPINMGAIQRDHSDKNVRDVYTIAAAEGMLPSDDIVYPGFHMRNSEVGFTAVTVDEFSFRLVCLNGMMVTVGDSRLLYRQHRPIDDATLDKQIGEVFENAPVRWEGTRQRLTEMRENEVDDAEKMIDDVLKRMDAPKHFREHAVKSFEAEPLRTEFGILQAITRAAQEYEDMDQRFEFEALAGRFMARGPRARA